MYVAAKSTRGNIRVPHKIRKYIFVVIYWATAINDRSASGYLCQIRDRKIQNVATKHLNARSKPRDMFEDV